MIELLVVISIIALLLSIVSPSLQKAKDQARLVICSQREKQIMQVHEAYSTDNFSWIIAGCQSPGVMWTTVFHDNYGLDYDVFHCPGDKVTRYSPEEHPMIQSGYSKATSLPIYPRTYTFSMYVNGGVPGSPFGSVRDNIKRMNPDVPMIDKKGSMYPDYQKGMGFPCRITNVQIPSQTVIHDEYASIGAVADWHWSWEQMFPQPKAGEEEYIPHGKGVKRVSNIAFLDGHTERLTLEDRIADPDNYAFNSGYMLWVRKVR